MAGGLKAMVKGTATRAITRIIVHQSASRWGDAQAIDEWHRERGWNGIGYHFVICNGFLEVGLGYHERDDGLVQPGRHENEAGAHAKGNNDDSIGICLIGVGRQFTRWQYTHLLWLIEALCAAYPGIGLDGVIGHYEVDPVNKPDCPGFDMELVRASLAALARREVADDTLG